MSTLRPTLVIDVDSSSIGLCLLTHDAAPSISNLKRVSLGTESPPEITDRAVVLSAKLKELLTSVASIKPDRVVIVVSSPWFETALSLLTSSSPAPTAFTRQAIDATVQKYKKSLTGSNHQVVPLSVRINGYTTHVATHVSGTTLEIDVATSTVNDALVAECTKVLRAVYADASITFIPSTLVQSEVVLSMWGDSYGTILSVHGDCTDVTVLVRNSVGFLASVPSGSQSFVSGVSDSQSTVDGASRLALYAAGTLVPQEAEQVLTKLTSASDAWRASLKTVFATAQNTVPTPSRMYLCAPFDVGQWLSKVIPSPSTNEMAKPVVVVDALRAYFTLSDTPIRDTFLMLACYVVHTRMSPPSVVVKASRVLYSIE